MTHVRIALVAVCGAVLFLSGCSGVDPGGSASAAGTGPSAASGSAPEFDGPWASTFSSMYERAGSDFERQVLSDGKVTDQEYAETLDRFTECLSAYGHYDIDFGDDGGFTFNSPKGSNDDEGVAQVEQCSKESGEGGINALYHWMKRNPENLDESTIMAACLVRKGAVDPSYSATDFDQNQAVEDFPYLSGHGRNDLVECSTDPLGLFE
ncbi:hypothetical protein [Leucobacter triazinivorans]|uniref:Lipoprotein n=1 Tax=Leucobacter triazinivorans TaxID=1784719 RepID=A0A4P6KCZ9_9MICO|nr:hypothetical protein [Leucobacter triazinivorans]QBE48023.1 hypothetical protein EVS81_03585 [Leucobacter triazinivorans]